MSADLHTQLVAALDEEQARAEAATPGPWSTTRDNLVVSRVETWTPDVVQAYPHDYTAANLAHIAAQDPARTLVRVAADRRVLERHRPLSLPDGARDGDPRCTDRWGDGDGWAEAWPCPDVRDLTARYGIEVEP